MQGAARKVEIIPRHSSFIMVFSSQNSLCVIVECLLIVRKPKTNSMEQNKLHRGERSERNFYIVMWKVRRKQTKQHVELIKGTISVPLIVLRGGSDEKLCLYDFAWFTVSSASHPLRCLGCVHCALRRLHALSSTTQKILFELCMAAGISPATSSPKQTTTLNFAETWSSAFFAPFQENCRTFIAWKQLGRRQWEASDSDDDVRKKEFEIWIRFLENHGEGEWIMLCADEDCEELDDKWLSFNYFNYLTDVSPFVISTPPLCSSCCERAEVSRFQA